LVAVPLASAGLMAVRRASAGRVAVRRPSAGSTARRRLHPGHETPNRTNAQSTSRIHLRARITYMRSQTQFPARAITCRPTGRHRGYPELRVLLTFRWDPTKERNMARTLTGFLVAALIVPAVAAAQQGEWRTQE